MASPEPVAISALQHWSYCPRQCALIHAEQVFSDNVFTSRGHAVHARVDAPGAVVSGAARVERGMPLWNDRVGLIGRADLVEFLQDGTPYPVEYKHGPRRSHRHDDLQLAAQAICLEEMTGRSVNRGAVYHFSSRRRREVEISSELRVAVEHAVFEVREMLASSVLPPPVHDRRCRNCSLIELCQPKVVAECERYRRLLDSLYEVPQ